MYSRLQLLQKYIRYYLAASDSKGHGVHSPFVFEFITKLLNDKTEYPEYRKVEALRNQLLKNKTILEIEDFGAGSGSSKTKSRSISSVAKNAAKPAKFGQLLFRMIKYYQPQHVIEIGSSLGISSGYISLAKPGANFITLEGSKEIAEQAVQNFKDLGLTNIKIVTGNFDETLGKVLNDISNIDFVFIDGNHRQEPTERYFQQLLAKIHNETILVFDDIHWSSEMEAAWKNIKHNDAVTCSIDLFFAGIIFFRKEFKEKQDFIIRF